MQEWIGEYKRLTPMKTAGSGSARWCIVSRGLERFFLKEFLSPVHPLRLDTPLAKKQQERCEWFAEQKRQLYSAAACVIGETLVPVVDFFCYDRRYYAISPLITDAYGSAENAADLDDDNKRMLLRDVALCLQRLHAQGIVHADLKPEHVLLIKLPIGYQARLIDLDSGFLTRYPPQHARELEGDPVYLAPEAFLRMAGQQTVLDTRLDTFAFGGMIHRIWTGELPSFDRSRYGYLYEAALDGGDIALSAELSAVFQDVVRSMLSVHPQHRPNDAEVVALFDDPHADEVLPSHENGLRAYFKKKNR